LAHRHAPDRAYPRETLVANRRAAHLPQEDHPAGSLGPVAEGAVEVVGEAVERPAAVSEPQAPVGPEEAGLPELQAKAFSSG
jgi:hypothetical protein